MSRSSDFKRRIVIGTPVTPKALFPSLAGSSFCVSHQHPRDIERAIEFVGEDEILILDNGAFSHWNQGKGAIDRNKFWDWANEIQARSPQAVAVIPDVIEGDEHANLLEMSWALREAGGLAEFPERTMSIWHLNDSLEFLETQARLMNFVGFGSCAEFDVQRQKAAYMTRITEASAMLDDVEDRFERRPWIHLMRGLGVLGELTRFESADSTNVAVNHHRYKAEHGDKRAAFLKSRIQGQVDAGLENAQLENIQGRISNFDDAPTQRPTLAI